MDFAAIVWHDCCRMNPTQPGLSMLARGWLCLPCWLSCARLLLHDAIVGLIVAVVGVATAAAQTDYRAATPDEQMDERVRSRILATVDLPPLSYDELPAALARVTGLCVERKPAINPPGALIDIGSYKRYNAISARNVTVGTLLDLLCISSDMRLSATIDECGTTIRLTLDDREPAAPIEDRIDLRRLVQRILPEALVRSGWWGREPHPTADAANGLIEVLRNTVQLEEWQVNGGRGTMSFDGTDLVVRAPPFVCRDVRRVLREIDAALSDREPIVSLDPPPAIPCDDAPESRAVWQSLAEPRDWPALKNISLEQALREFAGELDINFMFDAVDYDECGQQPKPVTLVAMRDVPPWARVEAILRTGLPDILSYQRIRGGVLCVGPAEAFGHDRTNHLYFIGDLLAACRRFCERQANLQVPDVFANPTRFEYVLMASVVPPTWQANGGTCSICRIPDWLVVNATANTHRAVEEFLWQMRSSTDADVREHSIDPPATEAERRENRLMHERLNRPISGVRVSGAPFSDAVRRLAALGEINLVFESLSPEVDLVQPSVSLAVNRSETLRSALDRLLGSALPFHELRVAGGLVWIADRDRPMAFDTRVYRVDDLLFGLSNLEDSDRIMRQLCCKGLLSPERRHHYLDWVEAMMSPATDDDDEDRSTLPLPNGSQLTQLICDCVAPDSWQSNGGIATCIAWGPYFVACQSQERHRRIEEFLREMRRGLSSR